MDQPDDAAIRLRLDIAYDGGGFSGWAAQPSLRTVQDTLEGAIARVLRISAVRLTVAGRTDAGVHARGQVAHVDVPREALGDDGPDGLARRLARLLPEDVRVRKVTAAAPGFDARFSALWRRYAYRIADDPATADPLERQHTLPWPRRLDVEPMRQAAAALVGHHDFAAFCKQREGATTVRTLLALDVTRTGALVVAEVRADAFCHSMVRSLLGALVAVGEGRRDAEWPAGRLSARQRDSDVPVLAARGLTLEEVAYPADGQLAERAAQTRAVRAPA